MTLKLSSPKWENSSQKTFTNLQGGCVMKRALKSFTKKNIAVCGVHLTKVKIPPDISALAEADKYKQINKLCNLLLISMVFLIFYSTELVAQGGSQPEPMFPLGVWATGEQIDYQPFFNSLDSSGLNTLLISVSPDNNTLLEPYKVITQNGGSEQEAVYYYTNGMYYKWEAERDTFALLETGFKHTLNSDSSDYIGYSTTYQNKLCWTTGGLSAMDSVLWGPNYRQDKNYRLKPYLVDRIVYTAKYSIALGDPSLNPLDDVCEIKVVFCYLDDQEVRQCTTLVTETKTVADFPDNSFQVFDLEYSYPSEFDNPILGPEGDSYESGNFSFDDTKSNTGIEFQINWLGTGTLYVDYVEVYDNAIWEQWVNPLKRDSIVNKISTFLSTYSGSEWDDIIQYWFGKDEPQSIDYYEPMRIVDSLIRTMPAGAPLVNQFMPQWNGARNGDRTIPKFVELVQPDKLMFDSFPFRTGHNNEFGFNYLRLLFQEASISDPEFWYVAQGFGQYFLSDPSVACGWRRPAADELKASVMLGLAHGCKGILFWKYSSNGDAQNVPGCGEDIFWKTIVGDKDDGFPPRNLFFMKLGQYATPSLFSLIFLTLRLNFRKLLLWLKINSKR